MKKNDENKNDGICLRCFIYRELSTYKKQGCICNSGFMCALAHRSHTEKKGYGE